MKMRELEEKTGVDREVIRILLRKGLIPEPQRRTRNSADYDETHVRAISVVRDLQRGSRLTLDQIKDALAGTSPGRDAGASAYHQLEELLAMRFGLNENPYIALSSLAERHPMAERDARAFAAMSMVTLVETPQGPKLSFTDARLVEIWAHIRSAGFVEETGFPPENISFYLDAARHVAQMEAKVFLSGSTGRIPDDKGAAMLQEALPLMLDFFGLLRLKEFMSTIHAALQDGNAL